MVDRLDPDLAALALEATESSLVIVDALGSDHPIIHVNAAFEHTTGYSAAEAVGRNCRFLQNDERDQPALTRLRAALSEGRGSRVVLRNFRKDGTPFWNRLCVSPIRNAAGTVTHFVGIQNDVTEQKAAEEAMEANQERFKDFAAANSDWFWETDADHRFTFVSENVERMVGVTPAWHYGKTAGQLFGASYEGKAGDERHRRKLREHRPFRDFVFGHTGGGETRWLRSSGQPMFSADGSFIGYRGATSDDSERIGHAVTGRASQAKSEFLAHMSHELRTPLTAILGFAEVMMSQILGPLDSRYKEYSQDIYVSAQHLLNLVNDLLDLSKVEAGKFELLSEAIDLGEAIEEALRILASQGRRRSVEFTARVAEDLPLLNGDRRLLRQILLNLVSNALKFTPEGGRVEVLAAFEDDKTLVLEVRDSGVGIAPEDMERILEPYGQVRAEVAKDSPDTGLGLPLAKAFTELHDGTLEVKSVLQVGTSVIVRFPPERVLRQVVGPPLRKRGA